MFAVIKTGGKQYKVQPKGKLKIEKLEVEEGKEIEFKEVLLIVDEDNIKIGDPLISGASVKAKVLQQGRARKVIVEKFRHKVRYHKKYGHRQPYTQVEIVSIK